MVLRAIDGKRGADEAKVGYEVPWLWTWAVSSENPASNQLAMNDSSQPGGAFSNKTGVWEAPEGR